jgi:hypothetical protein
MKQIKTISKQHAELFDEGVNTALMDGWKLSRRYRANDGCFVAELEKEVITERERCCENCAHFDREPGDEPCCLCNDGDVAPTHWESREAGV